MIEVFELSIVTFKVRLLSAITLSKTKFFLILIGCLIGVKTKGKLLPERPNGDRGRTIEETLTGQ